MRSASGRARPSRAPLSPPVAVIALAAGSAHGRSLMQAPSSTDAATCAQLQQQAATLSASQQTVATASATLAAGGPVPAENANWAPWPAHSWPGAQSAASQTLQAVSNNVAATDSSVTNVLQQMQSQGCTLTCAQMQQLITDLQAQAAMANAASANVADGGGVPPADPNWAPWPAHSWPSANTPKAQAVQQVAQQVSATDAEVNQVWQQMQTAGC